jgi:SMC interacting uncharacterized protein involved in chromosome segregation
MQTIKDAIRDAIDTQNPIMVDTVVDDVKELFPDASIAGIKTEACKILRDGDYKKERIARTRAFKWIPNTKPSRPTIKLRKKAAPDPEQEKEPTVPKDGDITMAQAGQAIHEYINELRSKIQKMSDMIADEQRALKEVREHLQAQIESKAKTIEKLNHKLIVANKRIHGNDGNGKTFNMSEIAHFAKR